MKTDVYLENEGRPQYGADAMQENLLDNAFNVYLNKASNFDFQFRNEPKESRSQLKKKAK